MKPFYLLTLLSLLTACGGGGGGAAPPATIAFAPAELATDCSGSNCGTSSATTPTYSGSGAGVWRYENTSGVSAVGTVSVQNLTPGQTVTMLFTNAQSTTTAAAIPAMGTLASPVEPTAAILGASAAAVAVETAQNASNPHKHIRDKNRLHAQSLLGAAASRALPIPTEPTASASIPRPVVAVGATRDWIENGFDNRSYATTARIVCNSNANGRNIVFWVQTGYTKMDFDADLASYQSQFCGASGNGQYAKISAMLGDAWGNAVPSKYSSKTIADAVGSKLDINIVIVNPGLAADWGGYFYALNNALKSSSSTNANSNEALIFFVNALQSPTYINSVLIHELTHMINFYQRTILHDDVHEDWLEETSASMTQDIFDPGLRMSNFGTSDACVPIACEIKTYARSGGGIDYFNWPQDLNGTVSEHYALAGAFGAFLNRRFGPALYAQLMTDCYTPATNVSSLACVDFLIQKNGGVGFADEFARLGATIFSRMGASNAPAKYGFPAKSGTLTHVGNLSGSYSYNLPAMNNWWLSPSPVSIAAPRALGSYTPTTHTYRVDTVATGKTSYVRTGVLVPAKTNLIVTVK